MTSSLAAVNAQTERNAATVGVAFYLRGGAVIDVYMPRAEAIGLRAELRAAWEREGDEVRGCWESADGNEILRLASVDAMSIHFG